MLQANWINAIGTERAWSDDKHILLAVERLNELDWAEELSVEDLKLARRLMGASSHQVFIPIDEAAGNDFADWGHWDLVRNESLQKVIETLLPVQQESRSVARYLELKFRLAVYEGNVPEAVKALRTQFRLGYHIANSPFIVSRLVGAAICSEAVDACPYLIQKGGGKNFYYAFATLPDPLIDFKPAIEAEFGLAQRAAGWPDRDKFDDLNETQWRANYLSRSRDLLDGGYSSGWNISELARSNSALRNLEVGLYVGLRAALQYPRAKKILIDEGIDQAKIDDMPVGEVIARVQYEATQRLLQGELAKLYLAPHRHETKARTGINSLTAAEAFVTIPPAIRLLSPATAQIRHSGVRLDAKIAALKTIEALRAYAAAEGSWPESLDDIKIVPVPENPRTGRPFSYRLEGGVAVLEAAISSRAKLNKVYRLRLIDTEKESD
ncbi:hypothetical protein [Stratiformator vulcanicus]|nr:hypothetical protein [Stratiformator vulcanicus]